MNHLTLSDYLRVLRGQTPVEELVRKARRHLREFGPDGGHAERLPADLRLLSLSDLEAAKLRLSRVRAAAREARKDLHRLLKLPRSQWRRRVADARTRFRSRAFAQLLLTESRRRQPEEPLVAADLAALVPEVLSWTVGRPDLEWAPLLLAAAASLRSEARRTTRESEIADGSSRDR